MGRIRTYRQLVTPVGVFLAVVMIGVMACQIQGCGSLSTQEDSAATVARIAGGGLRVAVDVYAPQYALPLQGLAAVSLGLLQGQNVDLAGIVRDTMILVKEISTSDKVDRYAGAIQQASTILSGLIRLNWDVPEEYQRARAILTAFFDGVRGTN